MEQSDEDLEPEHCFHKGCNGWDEDCTCKCEGCIAMKARGGII